MGAYYVRKTGHDDTGDGSTGSPWLTVSKALTTVSLAGGHTIYVGDGTYQESTSGLHYLYHNRTFLSEVIVRSESGNPAACILQGETSTSFTLRVGGTGTYLTFKNVSLIAQNATVTSAIRCQDANADHIKFDNCPIVTVAAAGVGAALSALVTSWSFLSCTFSGGATAISSTGTGVTGLTVSNCTGTHTSTCVSVTGANTGTTITGCTFHTTGAAICGRFDRCADPLLDSNRWQADGANGVALQIGADGTGNANSNITISGGSCISILSHAMLIGGNTDGGTVTNVFVDGWDNTVVLKQCINVTVTNCTGYLRAGAGGGLYHKGSQNCSFQDCTIRAVSGYALRFGSSTDAPTNDSFLRCKVFVSGTAAVLDSLSTEDGGGNVCDYNVYRRLPPATWGKVQSTVVASLAAARAGWAGYGDGSNDNHSRMWHEEPDPIPMFRNSSLRR